MKMKFDNMRCLDMHTMEIFRADVCTDGSVISYVGTDAPHDSYDRIINGNKLLLIPGFNNAHTHSPMTFLRSHAEGLPLDRWLNEAIFPNEAKLTPDDIYTLTKLAAAEYLSGGITSCFDMYFGTDSIAAAFTDTGFRCVFCGALNNFSESIEKIEEDYLKFNKPHSLISYKLGFHAEYTTSIEIMTSLSQLAHKYNAPVWCHNSETRSETDGCIKRYGMTPTALMDSIGMFDFGGGGYHCVYLTPEDMEIFRRHNMTVVTNPASNSKLASGIADLTELAAHGIPLAIGTDGAASNNSLDMFKEMYLASVLQKLKRSDASTMPSKAVLSAAISGGARAMGLDRCGYIEKGMLADLTVIDLSRPSMQPENDIVNDLVFSGSRDIVKMTLVNGQIRYEDGEFYIGEDMNILYEKCRKICKRIFSQ